MQLIDSEIKKQREIERILAGNGKVENILKDAKHIFEAHKYGSYYFITNDKGILKRADMLSTVCNVKKILKPSEFLSILNHYINYESG